MLVIKLLIGIGLGAGFGALLGVSRSCETGACPLTANPGRGAFFGGLIGLMFALTYAIPSVGPSEVAEGAPENVALHDAEERHLDVLNEENFKETIAEGVVLVDFWAPWCGPCRQQLPILEGLVEKVDEDVLIGKVNVDDNRAISREYRVSSIPTLILFVDGEPVERFVGVQTEKKLLNAIDEAEEGLASP